MGILKKRSFVIICSVLICLNFMPVEQLFVALLGILFFEIILHENKLKVRLFPGSGWYLYFIAVGLFLGAYGIVLYGYTLKHIIKDLVYVLFPFLFWMVGQNIKLYMENDSRAKKECYTQLFVAGVLISLYDLLYSLFRIFTENISMTSLYSFRSVIGVGYHVTLFTLFLYVFIPQKILFKKRQASLCLVILLADMLIHFSRTILLSAAVLLLYSGIIKNPVKVIKSALLIVFGFLTLYVMFPYIFGNFLDKVFHSFVEMSYSHVWNHAEIVNNWRGYEVYCELQKFHSVGIFEKLFGGGFGAQLDMRGYAYLVTTEATIPFLHNGYYSILMIWGIAGCVVYFIMLFGLYLKGKTGSGQERRFWRALIVITALNTLFVHGPFFSTGVSSVFLYLGVLETEKGKYIRGRYGSSHVNHVEEKESADEE